MTPPPLAVSAAPEATFAARLLGTAFPFWFALDANDRIAAEGPALARWHKASLVGEPVGARFRLVSPRSLDFTYASAAAHEGQFVIVETSRPGGSLPFRGQFVSNLDDGTLTFIGSPWVADTNALEQLGLSFSDFAVHDPVVDYLLQLQTQRQAVDDVRRLADELQTAHTEKARAVSLALALSESRMNLLISQLPAIVFTLDADLRWTSARGVGLRALAMTPEMMVGRSLPAFFNLTDPAHPQLRVLRRALRDGEPGEYESHANGKTFRTHVEPQRDEDGTIVGVVGVALDVSEQRRAMDALRQSESSLAEAQELAGLGSYEYDFATREIVWSENCGRMLGVERGASCGPREWRERVHCDDLARFRGVVERAIAEKAPFVADHRVTRLDGTVRWMHHRGEFEFNETGLPSRLNGTVLDITERKRAEDRLAFLAHHDELTGLPNRTLFLDRLAQGVAHAERHGTMVAVLFVDLDGFKMVNDTAGHAAGDAVLRDAAARMLACVRDGDTLSRLGGDEFAAVLADVRHVDDAIGTARRLLDALAHPTAEHPSGPASASIGISLFPHDGGDAETLLRRADTAMYTAKESGGHTFRLYTSAMHDEAIERLVLENNLRVAIDDEQLFLEYQPIVNMQCEMVMVEALVRWNHPYDGRIPPDRFIPIAEESGLILPLGAWVLRTACRQLVRWHSEGMTGLRVAVNASARQFADDDFGRLVADVLAETGLEGRFLEIEITESAFMHDMDGALALMEEIKGLGVRVSVDDFGTGYSSLAYLQRLPVDSLKIDRSFVAGLEGGDGGTAQNAIARAIVTLGRSLELRVIAEGVESAHQAQSLRALGCDEMQGYYFSRPVCADEVPAMRKRSAAEPAPTSPSRGRSA